MASNLEWGQNWLKSLREARFQPCNPPFWARGGHRQTLLGHMFNKVGYEGGNEERVEVPLEGGGTMIARHRPGSRLVLYLFHGLSGSADSDYMCHAAQCAAAQGFAVYRANHRNCGEGLGLAPGPYHSGRAEDLSAMIGVGRRHYPDALHLALGFSLSGNALLLLLSGERGSTLPDLAIAVNAPIQLARTSALISTGFNRIYDLRFGFRFQRYLKACAEAGFLPHPVNPKPWWTIRDYDEAYTAPYGGFQDPEDYYRRCSTKELLHRIQVPTLLLTSADDPIVSVQDYQEARLSPSVELLVQMHGGHMGYFGKQAEAPDGHWLDYFWRKLFALSADLFPK